MKKSMNEQLEKEVTFGVMPALKKNKIYGFMDAFLVLSGYCIATWSYTQGAYLTTLVGFKQLLIGAFLGAILMLLIYQLPVILSVRYGIDIWIWFRSIFGKKGVRVVSIIIILINFPWYAVCSEVFASSMRSLLKLFGIPTPEYSHVIFALICVFIGTFVAFRGIGSITWVTRILVPVLLIVGVLVMYIGFTSVTWDTILNYRPKDTGFSDSMIPYIMSIEANFAFVITLVGGMGEIPRLTKGEKGGYYAGVLAQGLSGSFFVVIGAVMAIATNHVLGEVIVDPTVMLASLSMPALGLLSLLLVAFANIGTQAVGFYLYGVMLKSSFPKASYYKLILILTIYVSGLCIWGNIIEYFGSFLTVSACVYAPIAALLFVDFFFVRKQRISLYSAYGIKGYNGYEYTKGYNIIGLVMILVGVMISLAIYNPLTSEVHNRFLFYLTPTGASFLGTGLIYWILCKIPVIRNYVRRDQQETLDVRPFDRERVPPKQNLLAMPFIWFFSFIITKKAGLKIRKTRMKGVKPPYLVLGTHQSFTDFYVTPLALFPHRANYVSELEGFEAYGEWIYRQAGCLGTRKFVDDMALIKNIRRIMKRRGILVMYPEARYANVGTNSEIPKAVAKLAKVLEVPVVVINMKGNYLQSPIWNLKIRKEARLEAELIQVYTKEELKAASVDEIHENLSKHLSYDEYGWQKEKGMHLTNKDRAEGLHHVLYQCPECKAEFLMDSMGSEIYCRNCHEKWKLNTLGELEHRNEIVQIPKWYEWEREMVQQEIDQNKYGLSLRVHIEALPNAVNFIDCKEGLLVHNEKGFYLTFSYLSEEEQTLYFSPQSMISVHTEYNYREKGPCITLSTVDNTYFIYPLEAGFNPTKIQFATEYLYSLHSSAGVKGKE